MSSDLKDLVAFVNSFSEFGNYTSLNKEGAGGAGAGGEGSGGEAKIDGGGEARKAGEVGEEETVLKFQCEGRHTLTEFTIPEEQYFCDGCRENSEDEGWLKMKGCRVCDYDLCIECSPGGGRRGTSTRRTRMRMRMRMGARTGCRWRATRC